MTVKAWFLAVLLGAVLLLQGNATIAQDVSGAGNLPSCPAPPFSLGSHYFVSPDFNRDHMILARAYDGADHLYRSTDDGRTWQVSLDADMWATGFSSNYAQDHVIYAVPRDLGWTQHFLVRSTDSGASWHSVPISGAELASYGVPTLAVVDANTLFLTTFGGPPPYDGQHGLFTSTDAGATWQRRFVGGVNALALSPQYPIDHTLFIARHAYKYNGGLFKSTDNGRTWALRSMGLVLDGDTSTTSIVFSPGYPADSVMFCQSSAIFFRSIDAGDLWQVVYPPDWFQHPGPTISSEAHWILSPYFVRDRTAWIEHYAQLTTDAGDTWTALRSVGPGLAAARESCTGDGRCGVLLIGAGGNYTDNVGIGMYGGVGIYKSYDLGQTWHCPQEDVIPPWAAPLPAEVPEPTSWLLLGSGLAALAAWWRRHDLGR